MRFAVLDSWRGVCALTVALYHFTAAGHFLNTPFVRGSYLFVDFFFVLSGFVMTYAYGARLGTVPQLETFALRRIGRLWPLHLVALAAMIWMEGMEGVAARTMGSAAGVAGPAFTGPNQLSTILPNALLLHSLGFGDSLSWNIPSWSISAEMAAYAVFAAATFLLSRRQLGAFAIGVACASAAALVASSIPHMNVTGGWAVLRCLFGFFLGHLVFRRLASARPGFLGPGLAATAWEVAAVLAVVGFVSAFADGRLSLLAPVLFAAVVLVFSQEAGLVSRCMRHRRLVWLGTISYALYMVHYPLFILFRKGVLFLQAATATPLTTEMSGLKGHLASTSTLVFDFGGPWAMDLFALAFLMCAVVLAGLAHRWIEVPGQDLFLSLVKRPVRTR